MKKAFLLMLGISLFFSNLQAQTWEELTMPVGFSNILPFNVGHIYAKKDKIILIDDFGKKIHLSEDKAKTWIEVKYSDFEANAIYEYSNKLYLGGFTSISASSDNCKTWKAENGPFAGVTQFLEYKQNLYAVSNSKGILKLTPNTSTWTTVAFAGKKVQWMGQSQGILLAQQDDLIHYSKDDGVTWTATTFAVGTLTGIGTSGTTTMLSANFSNFFTSTDKGMNWNNTSVESHNVTSIDDVIYGARAISSTNPLGVYKNNVSTTTWEDFSNGEASIKRAFAVFNNQNGDLFALCDLNTDPTKKSNYKLYKSKVGKGVGTQTVVLNDTQVAVHPNPTAAYLNIECKDITPQSYQLTDVQGKIVLEDKIETTQSQINISDIAQGIYFLKIYCKEGVRTEKIVKK